MESEISEQVKSKYTDQRISEIAAQIKKSIEVKDRRHHFEKHNM